MKYPVNEIFQTVQAEGLHSGVPSLFVRLQGCEVGCSWCDTKHTWPTDGPVIEIKAVTDKAEDTPEFAMFEPAQILEKAGHLKHVVITGGEPCDHDLTELTTLLINNGIQPQIETSGTSEIRAHEKTWVTVSPKIDMPGGKVVLDSALIRADEIKMPVGRQRDVERLLELPIEDKLVYLQPLSLSPKATQLCIDMALKHGLRVSIQWHKFVNIR